MADLVLPDVLLELREPLLRRHEVRALDVLDLVDLLLGRKRLLLRGVRIHVHVERELLLDVLRRRGARLDDRDEDSEKERRHHHGHDRREARRRAAAERAEGLGDEEEDPAQRQLLGGLAAGSPLV
jgi:hypothetical protein